MVDMALKNRLIDMTWDDFRAIRFGFWIKSPTTLRDYAEKIGVCRCSVSVCTNNQTAIA